MKDVVFTEVDVNDLLEAISRIERNADLIKEGQTEVGESGVSRIDVIKEKCKLINIILKRGKTGAILSS